MKLKDYVDRSIFEYPLLYARMTGSYAEARLRVLDHLFLVLGNGLKWAILPDGSHAGYLTYAQYGAEHNRLPDPPYGKEKYEGPPIERYLTEPVVSIHKTATRELGELGWIKAADIHSELWEGLISHLPEEYRDKRFVETAAIVHEGKMKDSVRTETARVLREHGINLVNELPVDYIIRFENRPEGPGWKQKTEELWPFKPYPFATKYWPYAHIEPAQIQEDWAQGMLDVFYAALAFYLENPLDGIEHGAKTAYYEQQFAKYKSIEELYEAFAIPPLEHSFKWPLSKKASNEFIPMFREAVIRHRNEQRILALREAIPVLEARLSNYQSPYKISLEVDGLDQPKEKTKR